MLRDVWGWEGTDAMYMFKNWEEEYLECYTSFTSVCSGGGNWEGRVVPTKKKPHANFVCLEILFSIDLLKRDPAKDV